MKVYLLCLLLLSSSPALAQRHVELMAASCAACHGTRGHSIGEMPRLAGLEADYIVEQMLHFQSGEREATVMQHHATGYTEAEIRLLADFFARQ